MAQEHRHKCAAKSTLDSLSLLSLNRQYWAGLEFTAVVALLRLVSRLNPNTEIRNRWISPVR